MAIGGVLSYIKWGTESTYGSAAGTIDKAFGHAQTISPRATNNMERTYQLGARNSQSTVAKDFSGSATVSFELASGKFWRLVMGSVADAGVGPYTHTYSEANTLPSFTIENGFELGATDVVRKYIGCMVNTFTLEARIGEKVKCNMDILYANEAKSATTSSVVTDAETPFVFSQGTVELPDGTTLSRVQRIELSIGHNQEQVKQLGSRFAQTAIVKTREYNITIDLAFEDDVELLQFYGAASGPSTTTVAQAGATLYLTFTNGDTSPATDERTHEIQLSNIFFNEESLPQSPGELVVENITGWAHSCTVVTTDNTATG